MTMSIDLSLESGLFASVWSDHTGPLQWTVSTEEKEEKEDDKRAKPLPSSGAQSEQDRSTVNTKPYLKYPIFSWADGQHPKTGGEKGLPASV